jgi:hypothetical protein
MVGVLVGAQWMQVRTAAMGSVHGNFSGELEGRKEMVLRSSGEVCGVRDRGRVRVYV